MKKDLIDILAPGSIRESAKNNHIKEQRRTHKNLLSSSRGIAEIKRSLGYKGIDCTCLRIHKHPDIKNAFDCASLQSYIRQILAKSRYGKE